MSRKKVKKETVKRKTNIYDPMGVYGRGLTENQRLGMTRQMKIENIRNPGKVITRKDLEEYKKTLIYYGIPTLLPPGNNIEAFILEFQADPMGIEISNESIISRLYERRITPRSFICDSFAIMKPDDVSWSNSMEYYIKVGDSEFVSEFYYLMVWGAGSNEMVVIPSYWMHFYDINYFRVQLYGEEKLARTQLISKNLEGDQRYWNFLSLPNDGREMPYLLYPNNDFPELKFGYRNIYPHSGFKLKVKVIVMY